MPGIFISYRRTDAKGFAGALMRDLKQRFGAANVFMDVEDIDGGTDFPAALQTAVDTCDVLLALIGPGWLDARDAAGTRRLEDPLDFVRQEIRRAMERGIRVIPVLLDGAQPPSADTLPGDLAGLAARNALALTNAHWERQLDHLTDHIRHGLYEIADSQAPADFHVRQPVNRRSRRTLRFLLVVCGGLVVTGAVFALREYRFINRAAHGRGTVVEVNRRTEHDKDGTHSYFYPVVEFRTQDDRIVRITSSVGSDPPAYEVGEAVPVLYDPAAPASGCIDSFIERWFVALLFSGLGLLFFTVLSMWPLGSEWIRRRQVKALLRGGRSIVTTFHSVEDLKHEDENGGYRTYRIVTEWRHPLSKNIVHFRSQLLSEDPTSRVAKRLITVLVDPDNVRRYTMDLSFLQEQSEAQALDV